MPDEKSKYEHRPIPSYDEATSHRTSAQNASRSNERASESERVGLLGHDEVARTPVPTRRAGYRPPAIDNDYGPSRHSMEDSNHLLGEREHDGEDADHAGPSRRTSSNSEDDEVLREMEELEVLDPSSAASSRWTKHITSMSRSLSSFNLPFKIDFSKIRFSMPKFNSDLFILIGRIFAVVLVLSILYLLFMSDFISGAAQRMAAQMYNPEDVRIYIQGLVDENKIRGYLERVTAFDHIAGTEGDFVLAEYVEEMFLEAGLEDVRMDEFGVYLNYPKEGGRAVELLDSQGKVTWTAKLEEELVYTDPPRQQAPVFHGHSKAGDVKGPLVYANYGSREDFDRLTEMGVDTKGAIALVRYYGSQGDRALKVKAAELAGFVGCIIYSDPAEDGFVQGKVWPDGRYRPADGVQRGAVSLMSNIVGDVLTPGWSSKKGAKRLPKENNPGLNNIPSIPLAWRDAQHMLKAIQNFGAQVPEGWTGGVPDIGTWWTGNSSAPVVHLKNEQDEVDEQPIWNVMGRIVGVEQAEKSVIIGNHRDAWTFGASDPGSGTAVMLEVARIFGHLRAQNWRPLRTIEFASWDAEEYNLIGSTEFVEDNLEGLRRDGYAYLNVDVAVIGQQFRAEASPVFQKALLRCLSRVSDPNSNQTLRQIWDDSNQQMPGLGAGSDFVAFQDIVGTSSMDIGFRGPQFPYHSVYDNFEWMSQFGDPGFQYHKALAQVWALLILELADRRILPFDMSGYSSAVTRYVMDLDHYAGKNMDADGSLEAKKFSMEPLRVAALQFANDTQKFEEFELEWETSVYTNGGFESTVLAAHRVSHNNRMANFETHLLDLDEGGGLPGREQFKHILFAPQLWSGYDEAYFPAVRDAIDVGNWTAAQLAVEKTARILSRASHKLVGNI